MSPKDIFIGTPTHICKRYCADEFKNSLLEFANETQKSIVCNSIADAKDYYYSPGIYYRHLSLSKEFFGYTDSIHRRLVFTMNFLREMFLDTTKNIFLSLESDVILRKNTIDDIVQCLNEHKEIDVLHTNCYLGFNTVKKLSETDRLTLGCTAIRRHVLEKIKFRYDIKLLKAYHDAFFCHDAIQAGYKLYYHPDITLKHAHKSHSPSRGWEELPYKELHGEP